MSKERLRSRPNRAPRNRMYNQGELGNFGESRRRFLKLIVVGGVGGAVAVGLGIWRPWELGSNDVISPNLEKAQQVRQEIEDYIGLHPEDLSDEAINHIFELNKLLYSETFGRPLTPTRLLIATNEKLKAKGEKELSAPRGDAGTVLFYKDNRGRTQVESIVLAVFTGKPEFYNPKLRKLKIIDAIIKHELIHTQTEPRYGSLSVSAGDHQRLTASGVRGLKWMGIRSANFSASELGRFFDEVNTQLLAEYMNDPTNQDNIFRDLAAGNFTPISSAYIEAAVHLRRIYSALNISPFEVKAFHQHADPKGLLDKIDQLSKERGYIVDARPSGTLLAINPDASFDTYHLPLWARLAENYR